MTFRVIFKFKGFEESLFRLVPGLKKAMQSELMRVYNDYVDMSNNGITDRLNKEFHDLHPNYFEDNKGKDFWDLVEYNQYMKDGYTKQIIDVLNFSNASDLLEFKLGDELNLVGCLKRDPNVEIEFFLKEA